MQSVLLYFCSATAAHYIDIKREIVIVTDSLSEPAIEFDEEAEPDILEDDADDNGGGEDPDNAEPNDDNIVVTGDASAAAAAKDKSKNTVESEKSKRVDNDKRTTTPYMTKYERARVLGTRALQIR